MKTGVFTAEAQRTQGFVLKRSAQKQDLKGARQGLAEAR